VAAVCTTRFIIRKFYVVPTKCISVFYMVLGMCISLYSIHWLVYLTETECVYCAIRTEYLNIIQVIPGQSICDSVVDKWHWDSFFPPEYFHFRLSVSFHRCCCYQDKRAKPWNLPKGNALSGHGERWIQNYFNLIFIMLKICNCNVQMESSLWSRMGE